MRTGSSLEALDQKRISTLKVQIPQLDLHEDLEIEHEFFAIIGEYWKLDDIAINKIISSRNSAITQIMSMIKKYRPVVFGNIRKKIVTILTEVEFFI